MWYLGFKFLRRFLFFEVEKFFVVGLNKCGFFYVCERYNYV